MWQSRGLSVNMPVYGFLLIVLVPARSLWTAWTHCVAYEWHPHRSYGVALWLHAYQQWTLSHPCGSGWCCVLILGRDPQCNMCKERNDSTALRFQCSHVLIHGTVFFTTTGGHFPKCDGLWRGAIYQPEESPAVAFTHLPKNKQERTNKTGVRVTTWMEI